MKLSKAYFPHDFNARLDIKIKRLRKELGAEGYGIYWMIVETLCTSNNFRYPRKYIDLLADEFGVSVEKINIVISNYELFEIDEDDNIYSVSLIARLQKFVEFSKKQQEKANIRWRRDMPEHSNGNAVAMPEQCNGIAVAMPEHSNGNAVAMQRQCNGNAYKDKIRKENINNPPLTPPLFENEGEQNQEQTQKQILLTYYQSVFGRMGLVEQEFIIGLYEKFGIEKAKRLIREFRELNFHSVKTMKTALTEDGKIKPKDQQMQAANVPKLENWGKCEVCGQPAVTESGGIKACSYDHILELQSRKKRGMAKS